MSKRTLMIVVIIAIIAAGALSYAFLFNRKDDKMNYVLMPVEVGDIQSIVVATGTLNPVTTVEVGSQVSGRIAKLNADFNSRVKKGEVVADGSASDTVNAYIRSLEQLKDLDLSERTDRRGKGEIRFTKVRLLNFADGSSTAIKTGDSINFELEISSLLSGVWVIIVIVNSIGQQVVILKSNVRGPDDMVDQTLGPKFVCQVDNLYLMPGRYQMIH